MKTTSILQLAPFYGSVETVFDEILKISPLKGTLSDDFQTILIAHKKYGKALSFRPFNHVEVINPGLTIPQIPPPIPLPEMISIIYGILLLDMHERPEWLNTNGAVIYASIFGGHLTILVKVFLNKVAIDCISGICIRAGYGRILRVLSDEEARAACYKIK